MAIKLQTIVDLWETTLAKIKVASGYHTTITTVGSYLPTPYAVSHLPLADIRDVAGTARWESLGSDQGGADAAAEEHTATFEIHLALNTTADGVRSLIMDVRKAVRDNMTATYDIRYLGHEMIVDQEEKRISGAVMRFELVYSTALFGEE